MVKTGKTDRQSCYEFKWNARGYGRDCRKSPACGEGAGIAGGLE